MTKRERMYCKIGQAVVEMAITISMALVFDAMFIYAIMK